MYANVDYIGLFVKGHKPQILHSVTERTDRSPQGRDISFFLFHRMYSLQLGLRAEISFFLSHRMYILELPFYLKYVILNLIMNSVR